jgi:23S rRNA (cytosine1962-C5)-methyltransferase
VVCDPPSFAPNQKAVRAAQSAYTKLNAQALRRVRPGGLFAAASCSSHVSMDMFLQTLRESSRVARRPLRVLEVRSEPPDHPTPLHFPEGRYLKFVLTVAE